MADIQFFQDDTEEGLEDGGEDDLVATHYGGTNPDDFLTPLQKLERYMESENIFTRQMVARGILETLRAVGTMEGECEGVLQAMARLSEDFEPSVRSELMEQIPHITMYCQESRHVSIFVDAVPRFVLPMIVRYLTDTNNQVRKTSQAALLVLLEKELVEQADVEEQICPIILELTGPESIDDLRTEAVAWRDDSKGVLSLKGLCYSRTDMLILSPVQHFSVEDHALQPLVNSLMSKMTPLIGKDITERLFLPRFAHLCSDTLFHVRKVCAANFGDMCSVVGSQLTEEILLSKFYNLCEDGVWGVRKACAECFMQVSCACSQDVRHDELAQHFVGLLCDQSRWVRMAAFQALGPFISTFADMDQTGLYLNEDGVLCFHEVATKSSEEKREEQSAGEVEGVQYSSGDSSCDKQEPDTESSQDINILEMDVDKIEELTTNLDSISCSQTNSLTPDLSFEEVRAQKYRESDAWSITSTRGSEADLKDLDNEGDEPISANQNKEGVPEISLDKDINEENSDKLKETPDSAVQSKEDTSSTEAGQGDRTIGDGLNDFNAFNYWRTPLPSLDLGIDGGSTPPSDNTSETKSPEDDITAQLDSLAQTLESQSLDELHDNTVRIHTASENLVNEELETVKNIGSTHIIGQSLGETLLIVNGEVKDVNPSLSYFDAESPLDSPPPDFRASLSPQPPPGAEEQDVIPHALLENYLSMIDPSRAQTVDTDIVRHCAYSFPAVAYTLGNSYWYCLKSLYETLAGDMQWKVRRTLAFSIHELAVILGPEITTKDLVPIFNGFLKDLDEVRIGVLKHLADFLRLLEPELRQQYLPKLSGFMTTDNNRNWRFRLELAEQLIYLCELYAPEDIAEYMVPLAMQLAADKVSEVRNVSFRVLSLMLRRLRCADDGKLAVAYVTDIIEKFANSPKWFGRQTFAQLCYHILHENAMEPERFAKELLPSLLSLATDSIPNVKIAVSRSLSQSVLPLEYFTCYQNPHHQDLLNCVQKLKSDDDRDVRFYATLSPQTDNEHHETVVV